MRVFCELEIHSNSPFHPLISCKAIYFLLLFQYVIRTNILYLTGKTLTSSVKGSEVHTWEKALIKYKQRRKYKYNLHSELIYETGLSVKVPIANLFLEINASGRLIIKAGYAWDGPSSPAIDSKNFMQGSLIHDALYQLMRDQVLPPSDRKRVDEILKEVCLQDGMSAFRAWYVYQGVRFGGAKSAEPDLLSAP